MMTRCPNCGHSLDVALVAIPPEPPLGTWAKDRYDNAYQHRGSDTGHGWGVPGSYPTGKWEAMWEARGPLVICGP